MAVNLGIDRLPERFPEQKPASFVSYRNILQRPLLFS